MVEHLKASRSLVITNCTTRKRAVGAPVRLGGTSAGESLAEVVTRWAHLIGSAPANTSAGELYVGRAMVEAKVACAQLGAELCVVSAGLGLVRECQRVPNYDMSASAAHAPLLNALRSSGADVAEWWLQLTRALSSGAIREMIVADPGRLVFVALPATYLRLVAKDLASIEPEYASNLRILTSPAGALEVPAHLRPAVLPYTEQLESIPGYSGTRAEFPQRALRHFVAALGGAGLPLSRATLAVRHSLSRLRHRLTPQRSRKTDEEIVRIIREGWSGCGGSSTKLLRYVRDERGVACEQARFRSLWLQVGAELTDKSD